MTPYTYNRRTGEYAPFVAASRQGVGAEVFGESSPDWGKAQTIEQLRERVGESLGPDVVLVDGARELRTEHEQLHAQVQALAERVAALEARPQSASEDTPEQGQGGRL